MTTVVTPHVFQRAVGDTSIIGTLVMERDVSASSVSGSTSSGVKSTESTSTGSKASTSATAATTGSTSSTSSGAASTSSGAAAGMAVANPVSWKFGAVLGAVAFGFFGLSL
ncbi:Ncw1p Ecym_6083 [Eremothecium cymbalariae DBVPG|uniref:Uncharacterized protein n=1 Tax=Eremothecium cymbalariae (strain CBS 270.75 / DBVPG 7215 / KCTC 17166 / NRRL Y-17582) TaxID=931890 RepID=G8JV00_ERECY|nr:hypothetical protein Ecym_6083 [Eremothecium cymbalariae DBVPG\